MFEDSPSVCQVNDSTEHDQVSSVAAAVKAPASAGDGSVRVADGGAALASPPLLHTCVNVSFFDHFPTCFDMFRFVTISTARINAPPIRDIMVAGRTNADVAAG
jgi:hypothetical protein